MNEYSASKISDTLSVVKEIKETVPLAVSEVDGALSIMMGWFKNVVLYPVRQANLSYKYKYEHFENELRAKYNEIPDDKKCDPKLMISGPTLEALKYTFDEKELREMFLNLLASSMNADKSEIAHPSFVEVIK